MREETIRSSMKFEGVNHREMSRYLAMTSDPWEWRRWGVYQFIPWRRYSKGETPGVTGKEALGSELKSDQWEFPDLTPSEHQVKLLVAACLGVGVAACFRLHTYTFGGKVFQQMRGGPIRLRLTCCVAKMRMINWQREVVKLLEGAGFKVLLALFYIDDVRIILKGFSKGFGWDRTRREFTYSDERYSKDTQEDLLDEVRVSRRSYWP